MNETPSFGKYNIVARIGVGGMAEVYLCRQTGLGGFDKLVVVKRIHTSRADEPGFVRMFLDEARIAAHLSHSNIVHIFEVDQVGTVPFIAMEYVRGPTLDQLARRAHRDRMVHYGHLAKIVSGVAAGLHYAHTASDVSGQPLNIVHRDVSPHNIIVSIDGVPKLLDFGVAKARVKLSITDAGRLKGKLRFMAPEVVKGKPVSARSDIFALGATLYEATLGQALYEARGEVDLLERVGKADYALPSALVPDFPMELERIVLWALEPDPARRCPTAQALRDALEAFTYAGEHASSTQKLAGYVGQLFADATASNTGIFAIPRTPPNGTAFTPTAPSQDPVPLTRPVTAAAVDPRVLLPFPPPPPPDAMPAALDVSAELELSGSDLIPLDVPVDGSSPRYNLRRGQRRLRARRAVRIGGAILLGILVGLGAGSLWLAGRARDRAEGGREAAAAAAVYLDEAEALARDGRFTGALELLARARELKVADPATNVRIARDADAWEIEAAIRRAQAALDVGDARGAMVAAEQALVYAPERGELKAILAKARASLDGTADAGARQEATVGDAPKPETHAAPPPKAARAEPEKAVAREPRLAVAIDALLGDLPSKSAKPAQLAGGVPDSKLPETYRVKAAKDLARVFKNIEAEAMQVGRVPADIAEGVTQALEQELAKQCDSGDAVEFYPRGMYRVIVREAEKNKARGAIARMLVQGHRDGWLKPPEP